MKARPDINVTPLIDVLLVLLIIFMVISPAKPHRFAAQVPQPGAPTDSAPSLPPPVIAVEAGGGLRLNDREMSVGEVAGELNRLMSERAADDRTVLISGAPTLAYHQVIGVIDLAKGAGASRQGLILDGARAKN